MDIEDLRETAALAHLNLGEEELAAAFPAFEQMLGYFAAMQGADGEDFPVQQGLSAVARSVISSHFRPDSQGQDAPPELNEKLLDNSGERDGRFVVIPNVL